VQSIETIVSTLRKHKPELIRKYPITSIGVFGSYVRGEASLDSDVDVAVEISAPMGLNFVAMADEIESLLGLPTDVVTLRSLKPEVRRIVMDEIIYV
jgi:hypothetical protein